MVYHQSYNYSQFHTMVVFAVNQQAIVQAILKLMSYLSRI